MTTKAKQPSLPEMEQRDLPEIEAAAEAYREIRDQRAELSKLEAATRENGNSQRRWTGRLFRGSEIN